jgi:hypothetical protein
VCARRSGTRRWRRSSWSGATTASPPRDSQPHRRRGPLSATRLPSSPRSSPACGLLLPAVLVGAGCRSPRPGRAGAHAAPSTRSSPTARAEPPAAEHGSSLAVRGAAPAVRVKVGGAPGGGHGGPNRQGLACCKSMIRVFEMFQKNVASVKCEYCKSRP